MTDSKDYIFHRNRYNGAVKPENLVFNANLQEFSQRVNYIINLETSGKMTPDEAYEEIKALWKTLKRSKEELGIGIDPFRDDRA
jgi:hypothetical protein